MPVTKHYKLLLYLEREIKMQLFCHAWNSIESTGKCMVTTFSVETQSNTKWRDFGSRRKTDFGESDVCGVATLKDQALQKFSQGKQPTVKDP